MYIYKTRNIINNKIYIGQSSRSEDCSYLGSGLLLNLAIQKYGGENFEKEILEYCSNKTKLNEREKYWIQTYNSTNRMIGYNISEGGQGGNLGEIVNQKISESGKGRIVTQETRLKRSLSLKGKNLGKIAWNKNKTLDYITWRGNHTLESKKKISEKVSNYHKNNPNALTGKNNPMYREVPEDIKQLMIKEREIIVRGKKQSTKIIGNKFGYSSTVVQRVLKECLTINN